LVNITANILDISEQFQNKRSQSTGALLKRKPAFSLRHPMTAAMLRTPK